MFWLSMIPVVIVTAALVRILWRRRREGPRPVATAELSEESRRTDRRVIVLGGVILPLVLLIPVAIGTIATASSREPPDDEESLQIEVTAHQFWWDLTYPAPGETSLDAGETFRTANELHVPVGRPVELVVTSEDVIHSLWVPELDGKIDLIPGRINRLRVQADRPGVYQGRCAEYCGLGHTSMRLLVVALEPADFEEWHENEAEPIDPDQVPVSTIEEFGDSCGPCHNLSGVYESGTFRGDFGPDLTHFGSRRTIAAGALPNTRDSLARWIIDAPSVKQGTKMPAIALEGPELAEIVDFLGAAE